MAALSLEQQLEAIDLYKSGLSAARVAQHFGVKIDAVFYTLRRHKVERRSIQETNRIRYEGEPLSFEIKTSLTDEEEALKLAAVMLYWAEGHKLSKGRIDFANSDPAMALIFKRFLSEICNIDETKIRCALYCYEGQDIDGIRTFWSTLLHVPQEQFTKPYIKQSAPGPQGPRMVHGLVHVRYCDKKLLRLLLEWIDEYQKKLCVGGRVVNCTWL